MLLGTGGILGAGEKEVGVRYSALQFSEKDGKTVIALPAATKAVIAALEPYGRGPKKSLTERAADKLKALSDKTKEGAGPALEKAKEATKGAVEKAKELGQSAMEKGKGSRRSCQGKSSARCCAQAVNVLPAGFLQRWIVDMSVSTDTAAGASEPSAAIFVHTYNLGKAQVVWTRLVADLETPVSAYLKLSDGRQMTSLLESVEGGAVRGRYSFIGVDPDIVWRAHGATAEINRNPTSTPSAFVVETKPTLDALACAVG